MVLELQNQWPTRCLNLGLYNHNSFMRWRLLPIGHCNTCVCLTKSILEIMYLSLSRFLAHLPQSTRCRNSTNAGAQPHFETSHISKF